MPKQDKRVSNEKDSYKPAKDFEVKTTHRDLLKSVGISIEEIREERNISVSEMCQKVKISRTTYYRMKNGMVYFNTDKLLKIIDFLDADISIRIVPKSEKK